MNESSIYHMDSFIVRRECPVDLLTIEEVADRLRVPVNTIKFWRLQKTGPRGEKVGRRVMYRAADVEAWIAQKYGDQTPAGPDSAA
jgi:excisionase family DNA binding protein